jgi:hypothetical protein
VNWNNVLVGDTEKCLGAPAEPLEVPNVLPPSPGTYDDLGSPNIRVLTRQVMAKKSLWDQKYEKKGVNLRFRVNVARRLYTQHSYV